MQQVFPCPKCGAQNVVGQEFCQSCGQSFQYNCPHCGAIVDATLINCPGCRESLNWPAPQRVRPFPKQPAEYQRGAEGGEGGEEAKPKKKSNPWVTGCLGLLIIATLVAGAYLIYEIVFKQEPLAIPQLPFSSDEEIGFKPVQSPEFDSLGDAIEVVYRGMRCKGGYSCCGFLSSTQERPAATPAVHQEPGIWSSLTECASR